jgi:hypothetical protein
MSQDAVDDEDVFISDRQVFNMRQPSECSNHGFDVLFARHWQMRTCVVPATTQIQCPYLAETSITHHPEEGWRPTMNFDMAVFV